MLKKCEFVRIYYGDFEEFVADVDDGVYGEETKQVMEEFMKDNYGKYNSNTIFLIDIDNFLKELEYKQWYKMWRWYFSKKNEKIKPLIENILEKVSDTYLVCEIGINDVCVSKL